MIKETTFISHYPASAGKTAYSPIFNEGDFLFLLYLQDAECRLKRELEKLLGKGLEFSKDSPLGRLSFIDVLVERFCPAYRGAEGRERVREILADPDMSPEEKLAFLWKKPEEGTAPDFVFGEEDMEHLLSVYDAVVDLEDFCFILMSNVIECDTVVSGLMAAGDMIKRFCPEYDWNLSCEEEEKNNWIAEVIEAREIPVSERAQRLFGGEK